MEKKYMETLLAQIRERHAKERIRQEVKSHIDDQKAEYISQGLDENEAEEKAVADMGDPIETGTALDMIHKPRPAWGMLAVIAILCAAGVIIQYLLNAEGQTHTSPDLFLRQCFYAILGFFVLCIVYLTDYTRIAKFSRGICIGILLFLFIILLFNNGYSGNINSRRIYLAGMYLSLEPLLYLYIPAYGAVLYSYRNSGKRPLIKALLYLIPPILLAVWIGHLSLLLNLALILSAMFFTAAAKGWFKTPDTKHSGFSASEHSSRVSGTHVSDHGSGCHTSDNSLGTHAPNHSMPARCFARHNSKLRSFAVLGIIIGLIVYCIFAIIRVFHTPFQTARIEAWLNPNNDPSGNGYVGGLIHDILRSSRLIGENKNLSIPSYLPNFSTDFMVTSIIGSFGILLAAALTLLIIMLGIRLIHISIRQPNQLGMIMGLGCSMHFFIQSIEYILVNLGLLPTASLYLPLVSYGGGSMIQTCIFLGILLSIYRYQDVLPEPDTKACRNAIS